MLAAPGESRPMQRPLNTRQPPAPTAMVRSRHRRRVNRLRTASRWLGMFGAVMLVMAGVAAAVSHAKALRRQSAARDCLRQAQQHESNQQWLEAAQAVEAYLNLEPGAVDQRVRLARLYASGDL